MRHYSFYGGDVVGVYDIKHFRGAVVTSWQRLLTSQRESHSALMQPQDFD